ncbi:MAG TPA: PVC-type heme-binding CxxCH protein [Planctomycetota bacterium]|nr:PVC-type heme-binding CxxCH protein [Planctomycetota bacterium]
MLAVLLALALQEAPKPLDDRLVVELVAADPQIVTPVALDVDAQGRIFAIESHTHFPPKNYAGPKSDRIVVFGDLGPDGRARTSTAFADGFRHGMSIAVRPDGQVYFATRGEILILKDTNGDLVADERRSIVKLETKGDYPHNGLCGFAFDADGTMRFGMGENLGVPYRLVGSDGSEISGGGEGGNVFRCGPDGSKVERVATGVWNPFHMCFDARGRLWVVDNDPDSRPPCRLLHVVEGGDYGFKFRNGRKGLHPFTAWNGELPGTLPMTAGTGEAPSGVVAYEAAGLPPEYRGTLLATSWGDHVLQRFRLVPKGASFVSVAETVVKGGEDFRPVGLAVGPDGALYLTDWVRKEYQLHGKGRIWRVRAKSAQPPASAPAIPADPEALTRMNAVLATGKDALATVLPLVADPDPFLASAAITAIAKRADATFLHEHARAKDPRVRIGLLLAMRRTGDASHRASIPEFLEDPDPGVRRAAMQWVGEDGLREYAKAIELTAARPPVTREVFEAFLAAMDALQSRGSAKVDAMGSEAFIAKTLEDPEQPAPLRALSLRMLRKDHPALATPKLEALLAGADPQLRLEAVRVLSGRPDDASQALLRRAAAEPALRGEALLGLAHSAERSPETRTVLLEWARDPDARSAAVASLAAALSVPDARAAVEAADPEKAAVLSGKDYDGRPKDLDGWRRALLEPGDPRRGERVFFHPKGPQCASCHRVNGRGGAVGPDLSTVAANYGRERFIDSVLEPSKEIAPLFVAWRILTRDGDVVDGLLRSEDPASGAVTLVNAQGLERTVARKEIEDRRPSALSLMPEKLQNAMTLQEFRDLLSFLETLK